jgi:hypothetical protein
MTTKDNRKVNRKTGARDSRKDRSNTQEQKATAKDNSKRQLTGWTGLTG